MEAYCEKERTCLTTMLVDKMDFPAHFHEGLELLYNQDEGARVYVDKESRVMKRGDLAVMFSNSVHTYQPSDGPVQGKGILVLCPLALTGEYQKIVSEMAPVDPFVKAEDLHPDVVYALEALAKSASGEEEPNPRAERALVHLILGRILKNLELRRNSSPDDLVHRMIDMVAGSFREPISLEDVAERLGASRYTLSRLFANRLGCGFNEYLNRIRTDEAETLLRDTDLPFTEVWCRSGFETSRTFNRAFKRYHGCTPRDFRKAERQVKKK